MVSIGIVANNCFFFLFFLNFQYLSILYLTFKMVTDAYKLDRLM